MARKTRKQRGGGGAGGENGGGGSSRRQRAGSNSSPVTGIPAEEDSPSHQNTVEPPSLIQTVSRFLGFNSQQNSLQRTQGPTVYKPLIYDEIKRLNAILEERNSPYRIIQVKKGIVDVIKSATDGRILFAVYESEKDVIETSRKNKTILIDVNQQEMKMIQGQRQYVRNLKTPGVLE
jgi:hypothetical protein